MARITGDASSYPSVPIPHLLHRCYYHTHNWILILNPTEKFTHYVVYKLIFKKYFIFWIIYLAQNVKILVQQTVISIGFKIQYSQQVLEILGQGVKNVEFDRHYSLPNRFLILHLIAYSCCRTLREP